MSSSGGEQEIRSKTNSGVKKVERFEAWRKVHLGLGIFEEAEEEIYDVHVQ